MSNNLAEYGEAVRAQESGDTAGAANRLAKAFGAKEVTRAIATNVDRLTKPSPVLSDGLLRLMSNESRRRKVRV